MKHFVLFLLDLLIPTQPLYAAPSLTLDEALTTALKNHPQISEVRENLYGAEARTGQALANYYPQVSIVADWSRGHSYLSDGRITGEKNNLEVGGNHELG